MKDLHRFQPSGMGKDGVKWWIQDTDGAEYEFSMPLDLFTKIAASLPPFAVYLLNEHHNPSNDPDVKAGLAGIKVVGAGWNHTLDGQSITLDLDTDMGLRSTFALTPELARVLGNELQTLAQKAFHILETASKHRN